MFTIIYNVPQHYAMPLLYALASSLWHRVAKPPAETPHSVKAEKNVVALPIFLKPHNFVWNAGV